MNDIKQLKKELLKRKDELLTSDPTLYCSAMAHLRGKLHMTKMNGSTLYELIDMTWFYKHIVDEKKVADARHHMFHWTKEDQERYVSSLLEDLKGEEVEIEQDVPHFVVPPKKKVTLRGVIKNVIGI